MNKILSIAGLLVIVTALYTPNLSTTTKEPSVRDVLAIQEPKDSMKELSKAALSIIPDKDAREKFSIFNYEFSKRIPNYSGTAQKYNDVYVKAGEIALEDSFKGYTGLKDFSVNFMRDVISGKDKLVTENEKKELAQRYNALSWVLGE